MLVETTDDASSVTTLVNSSMSLFTNSKTSDDWDTTCDVKRHQCSNTVANLSLMQLLTAALINHINL